VQNYGTKQLHTYKNSAPLDRSQVPEPIFDENPALVDLYWFSWQLAWDHVVEKEGVPQSPYIDEGFDPNTIWIWDTCFMIHFCKYAPTIFPGIQSLENFYQPLHDGAPSTLMIHHVDNPPLFAWSEYEYARYTGDIARLKRVIQAGYLQRHFEFLRSAKRDQKLACANRPLAIEGQALGYLWNGVSSGMDNTPRGFDSDKLDNEADILWIDALAQQALAALYISRIAELVDEPRVAAEYQAHYEQHKQLINTHYWDAEDGFYYDISAQAPHAFQKVRTPASYWPLLAEVCDAKQAQALHHKALDHNWFGGAIPWPSVVRSDHGYEPKGMYWRGGVWVPTAYMATKALVQHGNLETAAHSTYNLLIHMLKTYQQFTPHTIWEAYNPEQPLPCTGKDNAYIVRPDFCGWSALVPISMFIENVLGFYGVDALTNTVKWHKHWDSRHGIQNLRLGNTIVSITAENDTIDVQATQPFTLEINQQRFDIACGKQTIQLSNHNARN
jgi:glycogen debranching enzyme